MSLFAEGAPEGGDFGFDQRVEIADNEYPKPQRLAFEKEMLGLYVSEHPLLGAQRSLSRHIDCTLAELRELREGEMRTVGGIITALSRKYTRKGDLMATFVLEDLGAALEVMVFPRTMTTYGHILEDDAIICVKGRLDARDEQAKIIALEIVRPELRLDHEIEPLQLRTKLATFTEERVSRLKQILVEHPGDHPAFVHLAAPERTQVFRLADDYRVDPSPALFADLREAFGPDCIVSS
jgi:DNA polymerase-3 subunit alpha